MNLCFVFCDKIGIRDFLRYEYEGYSRNKRHFWLHHLTTNYPMKSKKFYKNFTKGYWCVGLFLIFGILGSCLKLRWVIKESQYQYSQTIINQLKAKWKNNTLAWRNRCYTSTKKVTKKLNGWKRLIKIMLFFILLQITLWKNASIKYIRLCY
jgi:hypothetical protein